MRRFRLLVLARDEEEREGLESRLRALGHDVVSAEGAHDGALPDVVPDVVVLRGDREFVDFARSWWPVVDAVDVYGWLADPQRLATDARDVLSRQEIDDFLESLRDDFSVEDVPLLDELRYLLGEQPEPEPEDDQLADLYDETVP